MIHALIPFAIRGAIWYQGENNRNDGLAYEKKMEALIQGWRKVWKLGDFPFYYVQLAPYNYPLQPGDAAGDIPDFLRLPLIWEAQTNVLRIPNTGMAVITDITDLKDIHPRNKRDVGYRLALWARARTYGETDLVSSGPLYKSMAVERERPPRFRFRRRRSDRERRPAPQVVRDRRRRPDLLPGRAQRSTATRSSSAAPGSPAPKAVRFGWHQLAVPNLANKQGLPASPFRTDNW